MFDLVIRNGLIVDGTGTEPQLGDIAVQDGLLVQVGGTVEGEATQVIDATGRIVTPGFVDIHTHYDGQAFFDETLSPSSGHGVTTVVVGVCGIGFAPARPDAHELMVTTMESVEDIPGDVLRAGLPWSWETFPEFLDAARGTPLLGRHRGTDSPCSAPHVRDGRAGVGERTGDPGGHRRDGGPGPGGRRGRRRRVLHLSWVMGHTTGLGDPVPGTFATEEELFGIASGIAASGHRAVFQLAEAGVDGFEPEKAIKEVDWMRRLSAEFSLPVSFLVLQSPGAPELWRELMDACEDAKADGAELRPQVANRPFGMLLGLQTRHPFLKRVTYQRLLHETGSFEELCAELAKPEVRAAVLAEADTVDTGLPFETMGLLAAVMPQLVFPLSEDPDYEPLESDSLAARAAARGVEPLEVFYDHMLDFDGKALFLVPFFNYVHGSQDDIYEMLNHPAALMGLGDGGAHLATICDASMPTYQLSHWVKGRTRGPRLSLEFAVKMQTRDTAYFYGLTDRGTLEPGKKADLNVIDLDRLALMMPAVVPDLPTGASRILQHAVGYDATIVSGVVTRLADQDTGARPGCLIRANR